MNSPRTAAAQSTTMQVDAQEIADRLAAVRQRITAAAWRSARAPDTIRLVLASKTQSPQAIRSAYQAGAREFGENYVQEALAKQQALVDLKDVRWHLIGHLQSNKANAAAQSFDMIQTLDSLRLAQAIARARLGAPMPILVEINLGGEASKTGVSPDGAEELIMAVMDKVEVKGLMAIPPPGPAAEFSRPYFIGLRELRDRLAGSTGLALSELSMGMTDDFEVAIEEGASIVRVGRAIFGERRK